MGVYEKKGTPTKHDKMGIHFFVVVDPRGVEPLTLEWIYESIV